MKKRSLITMIMALTLVAVVGIGATLAYLSSTTGTLTNTFTVGNVKITQDESDESTPDPDDRTEEGNDYQDIEPGDELKKDPTVTVKAGSAECYVFMKLEGADALTAQQFTFGGFDASKWVKADGKDTLDGVYRYYETVKKSEADQVLEPLFTTVTYSLDATELEEGVTLSNVTIKSCAVQASNMTEETAYEAAAAEIAK